jgi:hypothetical protein
MTEPAPDKERDALWVTDTEMVRRMGVGINSGRKALQEMRKHPKFPPRSIGGKTYWPSAVDFFDLWNGRANSPRQEANHEPIAHRRIWPEIEAAKERLGREVARALDAAILRLNTPGRRVLCIDHDADKDKVVDRIFSYIETPKDKKSGASPFVSIAILSAFTCKVPAQ